MSTIWVFDQIENKHALCGRKDCMEEFCESLREHAKNINDFEEKKTLSLTKTIKITSRWKSMLHLWNKNL